MTDTDADADADTALANRLRKNARHLARWARREGLDAYRIYARDIPEFPYAIDRYGAWLAVQFYEGAREFDEPTLARHLATIAGALDIPLAQLAFKRRKRQRGAAQYEKEDGIGQPFTVRERGLCFEVELTRTLDSGLFLDHRETRRMVGAEACGKRVLNLFAYTGSFTVYAAAGDAAATVTVDMSHTYQAWTWRNLVLNDLADATRHRLVTSDVLRFLSAAAVARERFDLIVLDPPSFSNSKRMHGSFDVQRDHLALLRDSLAVLAEDGALYFSTNRQGFKLDPTMQVRWRCEELTARTLPEDFRRERPHRCWRIMHA
jgi:23S rRNA (cytosine1962-C5)-methyltransferase